MGGADKPLITYLDWLRLVERAKEGLVRLVGSVIDAVNDNWIEVFSVWDVGNTPVEDRLPRLEGSDPEGVDIMLA